MIEITGKTSDTIADTPSGKQAGYFNFTPVILLMYIIVFLDLQSGREYNRRVNRGILVSTKQPSSLQSFQLFYEELPSVKRIVRVRRVRTA